MLHPHKYYAIVRKFLYCEEFCIVRNCEETLCILKENFLKTENCQAVSKRNCDMIARKYGRNLYIDLELNFLSLSI